MCSENDKAVLDALFHFEGPQKSSGEETVDTDELKVTKQLEAEGVKAAETGDVARAILLFTDAITMSPGYASAYNNRAQAYRLSNEAEKAMTDLNEAIMRSNGIGTAACQAYTQRAMLHRLSDRLEEAKRDYEAAAALGSVFAKGQLAALNPYAAMCNQMMSKLMAKVQRGENEISLDWGPPA